jgi:hypothetical protein
MVLNCVRGFLQGMAHGLLTRNHNLQIIGLIAIDLFSLIYITRYRKHMCDRLKFILIFVYVGTFMVFNLFLGFYSNKIVNSVDY